MHRVAFALTGQQHSAEDLLQSALEQVYVRWERLSDPPSYARRVMYHEYVSWWRRWRRREVPVAVLPEVSDNDSAAQVLLRRWYQPHLERIHDDARVTTHWRAL